jgi:hypothetical protein
MCASIPGDLAVAPMPPLPSEARLMKNFYTRGFPVARRSNIVKKLERGIRAFIQKRLSLHLDVCFVHYFGKVFLWVRTTEVNCKGVYYSYETLLKGDVFIMTIAKDFIFT